MCIISSSILSTHSFVSLLSLLDYYYAYVCVLDDVSQVSESLYFFFLFSL